MLALGGLLALFWLMGARPSQAAPAGTIRYVTPSGICGITPCYSTIQAAINAAVNGDEIRVAADLYQSATSTPVLSVTKSITISGGYTTNNWNTPDPLLNDTILDGNSNGRVVYIEGNVTPAIEGFNIRNGAAANGAGIYNQSGQPKIRQNWIHDNQASAFGGGIYDGGFAQISDNEIFNNSALTGSGGGIYINNTGTSSSQLRFNTIYSNTSTNASNGFGGGVFISDNATSAFLEGNSIHHNNGRFGGGLTALNGSKIFLQSNLLYKNNATSSGGGLALAGNSATLWNNTVAANTALGNGGGIYIEGAVTISNTIIALNNGAGSSDGISISGAGSATGGYNNILDSGSTAGTPNYTDNPGFLDSANDNYHLAGTSPNIDRGDPNTSTAINLDIDQWPRPNPNTGIMDIGADEYYPDFLDFTFTPATTSDLVDRNSPATYNHTLRNTGTVPDTYTFTCSNNLGWTISTCPANVTLPAQQAASVSTIIQVPDAPALTLGRTVITATSTTSPTLSQRVVVNSTINPRPALIFAPDHNETVLPGETITYTHFLTNTGDAVDTFTIELVSGDWATLLPSSQFQLTVPSGASRFVQVLITVPPQAPAGLADVTQIRATSGYDAAVSDIVVDTITAKPTVGTRYVAASGDDENNNCTQLADPCRTIARGVNQASANDAVYIASGTYRESAIPLNDTIYISGGWTSSFRVQGDPDLTVVDAEGNGRLFTVAAGAAVRPTISNLTLRNGSVGGPGGAVLVGNFAQPTFANVIFENNQGTQGGAIQAGSNALVMVQQSWFYTNTATVSGGAVYIQNSTVSLAQNTFLYNTAPSSGGAVYFNNGFITLENNLFHANNTNTNGGAVYLAQGQASLWHNTFVENTANGNGGAIFNNGANNVSAVNTLLIQNTAVSGGAIYQNPSSGSLALRYSDIWQNSTPELANVTEGAGNISADPVFADDLFRLDRGSPALDTGDPNTTLTVDFEDDARPADNGYDMGYDELAGCRAQRDGIGEPFGSIQDAIAATAPSTLVRVTGICRGVNTYQVNGQSVQQTVFLTQTFTIQGGWNNDFTELNGIPAIIDPEGNGRAFYISGDITPILESLTLVNGNASGLGGGPTDQDAGGGIYNDNSNTILLDVSIMTSTATLGGGFYNDTGAPSFRSSRANDSIERLKSPYTHIAGNTATSGGGIYNYNGALQVDSTRVYSNTAVDGAGIYNDLGPIMVTNTVVYINEASGNGGGVYNRAATATFLHLSVYSNTATLRGGGFYNFAGNPILRSSIFESNRAGTSGPAIFAVSGSTPDIDYNYYYGHAGTAVVGANAGIHSILSNTTSPGFIDPVGGNFHLSDTANAIDRGDPDSPARHDFDGSPRPSNQGPDIGADEVGGCVVMLNGVIYGSIQAALDDAEPGDQLQVSGTCSSVHSFDTGSVGSSGSCGSTIMVTVHLTKSVDLIGGWSEDFSEEGATTTLDAQGLGRVLYIGPGVTSTVRGFNMINGQINGNGAGICIDNAAPTIAHNAIYSNTATNGGAIYSADSPAIIDEGNYIYANTAVNGAAVYVTSAGEATTIQNNFVYLNTAAGNGGAFYNALGNNLFWHNTIYSNTASTGGAVYAAAGSPQIHNNIVMSNTASTVDGIYGNTGSVPIINYNDFYGQTTNVGGTAVSGGNDVSLDPQFQNLGIFSFTLVYTSPVVDIGATLAITHDFEGDIRPSHQGYDMGADEVGGCFARVLSVPNVIYGSVQDAVDAASTGDTVQVDGVCYGVHAQDIGFSNYVTQTLFVDKNITIDGFWNYRTHITATLDAVDRGRVLYIDSGAIVTLTHIILQHGNGADAGNTNGRGGGVWNNGQLYLQHTNIMSSSAALGGGIYNDGFLTMEASFVADNEALTNGGGLYNNAIGAGIAHLTLGNRFQNNTAVHGGAIYQNNGNLFLDGNKLYDNIASAGGGAVYLVNNTGDDLDIRNNFIYNNAALNDQGGGVFNMNTPVDIWHNTFVGNQGGGIYSSADNDSIHSNIIDSNVGNGIQTTAASPDIAYNNVYNNIPNDYAGTASAGTGDISQAPLYMDASIQDYHLQEESPGVDEGDPNLTTVGIFNDYDNDLRPTNGGPDIGADEYNSCLIQVNDQIFGVLQDAVDYAESFAPGPFPEVKIARGSCRGVFENFSTNTKQVAYISEDLTIVGSLRRSNFTDPRDYYNDDVRALSTLIDAQGEGRAFYIAPGANVTVSQVILVNGDAFAAGGSSSNGGGTYHPGPGRLYFELVSTCQSTAANGGAFYGGSGSSAYITGAGSGTCTQALFDSRTEALLGWDFFGGPYIPPWFTNPPNSADNGGAYYVANGANVDIVNHGITFGEAGTNGGGLYNGGTMRLINVGFGWNTADSNGGGIYSSSSLAMYHNTIRDNSAVGGSGGGVYNGGVLTIDSSIVYSNTASSGGGGLHSTNGGTLLYDNFYGNLPQDSNVGTGTNGIIGEPGLWAASFALQYGSPNIDAANPVLLLDDGDGGVWNGGIDFDSGNYRRPDVHPVYADLNPIYGYASDVGMDEYWKEFGCAVTPNNQNTTVLPGEIVTYTVNLINVGYPSKLDPNAYSHGYTDTITITLASQSQGWSTLENDDTAYELDYYYPNDRVSLVLTVTVPTTATLGTQESSTVKCQSVSLPSRTATAVATTNVGFVNGLYVSPEYNKAAYPGDTLILTHTVANLGNSVVEAQLTPNAGAAGLSTAIIVDENGVPIPISNTVNLDVGEVITTFLRVTILDTAAAGEVANPGLIALDINEATNKGEIINSITISPTAGTRYVDTAGTDTRNNCLVADQPCATIQRAVDQALPGDTILVAGGMYTDLVTRIVGADTFEQVVFVDKSLTIRGGYTVNEQDPFTTTAPITNAVIIDGESIHRIFYLADGITVTLSSLFLQNGYAYDSSGTSVDTQPDYGGGIYNAGANLTITGTWVLSDSARFGSGLYHVSGNLSVHNSVFANGDTGNSSSGNAGSGAGINVVTGTVLLENNTFAYNKIASTSLLVRTPTANGDGAAVYQGNGALTLYNNIFAFNKREAIGGSISTIYFGGSSAVANDYNLYFNNTGGSVTNFITGTHAVIGDPQFEDGYYHITAASAAKNTGTDAVSDASKIDFELDTRPQGGFFDIGADERVLRMSFTFVPPTHTVTVEPNIPQVYTHTLTNTGDAQDTYTFTYTSSSLTGSGWTHSLSPANATLNVGESVEVMLVVTGTLPNDIDTTVITATPALTSTAIPRSVVDTTIISGTFGVDIAPSRSGTGAPNTSVSYTHTLTNTGDLAQFGLHTIADTPSGWTITIVPTQTALLLAGESTTFTVTVTIPAGTPADTVHTVDIEAYALLNPTAQDVLSDTTTVLAAYGLTLIPDNTSTVPDDSTAVYAHTLTNVGNITDTVALTYTSTPNWDVMMNPLTVVDLAPNASATVMVTVTVPPNTGGQTHIATITAQSQDVSVTATAVDTTTVAANLGVIIEPDNTRIVDAGTTLVYTHTITNSGNVPDTFTLAATSSQGWLDSLTAGPFSLAANESATVFVTVTVPGGAAPAATDTTTVTVASSTALTVTDSATDVTRVTQVHGLAFTPNNTRTVPSSASATVVTYTHMLTNTGEAQDEFMFAASSSHSWATAVPPVITLDSGQVASVVVTLTVPANTGSVTDTMQVTVSSVISSAHSATVTNTTIVTSSQGALSVVITPHTNTGSGLPGETLTYVHTVTNTGTISGSFTLMTADSSQGWSSTVNPTSLDLQPQESRTVTVTVPIPSGAVGSDMTTVTVTDLSGTVSDSAIDTTNVTSLDPYAVRIEPKDNDNVGQITLPGDTLIYTHTLTNLGSLADTYDLTLSGNSWATTVAPSSITLASGASAPVTVTVTIPGTANNSDIDVATVTATSQGNPLVFDRATDTTIVQMPANGVLIEPDNEGIGKPGQVITYFHTVTNTSDSAILFHLDAQSNQGWTTTVLPTFVTLISDTSTMVTVTVMIPLTAVSGTDDYTRVVVEDPTDPSITDLAIDHTHIEVFYGIEIAPDNAVSGNPGDTITYVHTVTSTSEITETFALAVNSSQGWNPTVTPGTIVLTPNQSDTVTVTVTIPTNALANTTDVTRVTISTTTPETAVTDSANDITTVQGNVNDGTIAYIPVIFNQYEVPQCVPGVNTGIDLVVTGISIDPNPPAGGAAANVSVTIRNQGSVDMNPGNNFFLDFYVDRQPTYLLIGDLQWGIQAAYLGAGQSFTVNGAYTFSGGAHQVWAQVDTDRTVNECPFETNNILGPISVNATGLKSDNSVLPGTPESAPRYTPTPDTDSAAASTLTAPNNLPILPEPIVLPIATPIPTRLPDNESSEIGQP